MVLRGLCTGKLWQDTHRGTNIHYNYRTTELRITRRNKCARTN